MTQKITIKIDDKILEGFDNITVTRNIETFCGSFSFEAYSESNIILPFNPSQECDILVDGLLFLSGVIDRVVPGYTDDSHTYNISGRDKTSVIVDNSIEGKVNFTAPIGIVEIIGLLIIDFSANIAILPPSESIENFKKEEIPSDKDGVNLFSFIEKLARQRGLLLRTNEYGNIVLEKNPSSKYNVKLIDEINGASNNLLEASFRRDYSQRYHRYKVHSQTNMSSGTQSNPDYNITGTYTDTGEYVNKDKYLEIESEISGNSTTNTNRAEWEGKIRAARSEVFACKVNGFIAEDISGIKEFWNINRLVDVRDDFLEINKTLLIKNINFNYSSKIGSTTSMELVDKDAYIIGS